MTHMDTAIKNLLGFCRDFAQNLAEIHTAQRELGTGEKLVGLMWSLWGAHGELMGSSWGAHGNFMGNSWGTHGELMGSS